MTVPSPAGIECVIRTQPDRDFLRLEAVIRSGTAVTGVTISHSSSGSSNNRQSGTFALKHEPEQVLTTIILDRSSVGNYRAELSLRSDHGIHMHFTVKSIMSSRAGLAGLLMLAACPAAFAQSAVPHNGNVAQTLQIGNYNRVYQAQSGGNNFSNVGIIGSNANNVGVLQGGKDFSNLALINTRGLSIGVIQPPGSAPVKHADRAPSEWRLADQTRMPMLLL